MEKKVPQKAPYVIELQAGKFFWCACGRSAKQPFCDGSHKETGITPIKFELEVPKKVALCGCKHSNNGVYCDGTHRTL
jgi:CDGSH-type Zn-finger protein